MRQRIYPQRHILPETVIERLEAEKLLNPIRQKALLAMLCSSNRGELQLADFQLRATTRMLRDLNSTKSRGMIVCAGTGTGKTLAFYLPALAHIAGLVKKMSIGVRESPFIPAMNSSKTSFPKPILKHAVWILFSRQKVSAKSSSVRSLD